MQLEKILEEIDQKIAKVRSIPISEDEFAADGEEIYYNGKTQGRYEELIWCRNIILKHMNDGWIPVEDKLPEVFGKYWATIRYDDGRISEPIVVDFRGVQEKYDVDTSNGREYET